MLKNGKVLIVGGTAVALDPRCCCGPAKCSICDTDTIEVTLSVSLYTGCHPSCGVSQCDDIKYTGSVGSGPYTLTRVAPGACRWTGTFSGPTIESYIRRPDEPECSGLLNDTADQLVIEAQRFIGPSGAGWFLLAAVVGSFTSFAVFEGSVYAPCCDDQTIDSTIEGSEVLAPVEPGGTATLSTGITECPCRDCCDVLYVTLRTIGGADVAVAIQKIEGCRWSGSGNIETGEVMGADIHRAGGSFILNITIAHPDCTPTGLCCRSKFVAVIPGSGCPEDATWVNIETNPTCGTTGLTVSCNTPTTDCPTDCSTCPSTVTVTIGGGTTGDGVYPCTRSDCTWQSAGGAIIITCSASEWHMNFEGELCSITANSPNTTGCPTLGNWTVANNTCGGTATVDVS